jgi:alpha-ribazole phosphatase
MKWLWIRHGETDDNTARRYAGHRDSPLSERGILQAELLRDCLTGMEFEFVFVSDLSRARETAAIALPAVPAERVRFSASLRECSFGRWEGKTYREIEKQDPELLRNWLSDPVRNAPPGGESLHDLDQRLSEWFRMVNKELPDSGTVAVFTHAGPIRWFLAKYVAQDVASFWEPHLPHGGGVWVERRENGWEIARWLHLPIHGSAGKESAG